MTHVEDSIYIHKEPEVVFDFVADERNEPTYNPRMTSVELIAGDGPGVGARYRATMAYRRSVTMTIECTEFERPTRLSSVTTTGGMVIAGTLQFHREGSGTRMNWSWEITPHGPARLAGPLIAWLGRRQERAIWAALKAQLEAPHVDPAE